MIVISGLTWNFSFPRPIDLMEWLGIKVRGISCSPLISTRHQIVNVYKYGDGDVHQKLVNVHPEYYSVRQCEGCPQERPTCHEELEVSEGQFREFTEAIMMSWKSSPEGLPCLGTGKESKWFGKAYERVRCDKEKCGCKTEE